MRKRILTNYIIIILLSALITGALASYFIKNTYINEKQEKLQTNITLIEKSLAESYSKQENLNLYKLAQEFSSTIKTRVTFINLEGRAISDSINNSIIFNKVNTNRIFKNDMDGEMDIVKTYSIEVGDVFFYLHSTPIEVGGRQVILRLGETYDEIDGIIDKFLINLIISTLIGVSIAILVAYLTVDKMTKPIKELTNASKAIASGDFSRNFNIQSKDEIQELAMNFNIMRTNINYNIDKIRKKNSEMDAILASLKDGIIALDIDKKIVVLNKNASNILCLDKSIQLGDNINDLLLDIGNLNEIIDYIESFKNYSCESRICNNSKLISLTTYPINDEENPNIITGTLIIISDITEIRNLENMRKDFVTNVSHELRTPLTSISGFVETLKTKELDEAKKNKALNIIGIETDRLKTLINELLDLSQIESIKPFKSKQIIHVEEVIIHVINLLKPQIDSKNIKIYCECENPLNPLKGEADLFIQMLINLIENSIKYNKDNGIINIILEKFNSGVRIIIKDQGIGIPEDDIKLIFNRFYRVDKSRSNIIEGSGLGLSIVKHIVLSFKGTIDVESKLGQGTQFTITIPN